MLLPKCLLVRRKSYSSRWTIAFSSAFVIGFFTHFTDDVVVSLLILSHYRAFSATAGAICLQSVHICIPTKKERPLPNFGKGLIAIISGVPKSQHSDSRLLLHR